MTFRHNYEKIRRNSSSWARKHKLNFYDRATRFYLQKQTEVFSISRQGVTTRCETTDEVEKKSKMVDESQAMFGLNADRKFSIISQEQTVPRDISRPAGEGGAECLEWQLNEV